MSSKRPWLKNYPFPFGLEYPDISLYEYLENSVKSPESPALIFHGQKTTYRTMMQNINKVATFMSDRGIKKGDRVALMMPNCPQFVFTYYAAMRIGAVVLQVNPKYTARELEFLLSDSEARHLFTVDAVYSTVRQLSGKVSLKEVIVARLQEIEINDDVTWYHDILQKYNPDPPQVSIIPKKDVAVFQYTGGTTGFPKGVMLTHFNLIANCEQLRATLTGWRATKKEQQYALAVIPFFHSYGMTVSMNKGLSSGDALVLIPTFDLETVLTAIKQYKPTLFPAVPAVYTLIVNRPDADKYGIDAIDICNSGAAPMPIEVMSSFEQKTGSKILEGYGLSEASPVTHTNPVFGVRKAGSIGVPCPDTDCRIVDLETGTRELPAGYEGELIIKGPQVMSGYWNRLTETAETLRDGWLYTGDIAKMDEDGYFFITDRKKDLILSGGFNVYPREVDEVLYEHPKVLHATTIGIPHSEYGESVKAFIVLKPGESVTGEEIIRFCKAKLVGYKCPREVEFKESLPMTETGKVLRRVLKEQEQSRK
jgi:long-chain acyl-CoA synthetase